MYLLSWADSCVIGGIGATRFSTIYHYDPDNDDWNRLPINLPAAMYGFSGCYDHSTHLLHIIYGESSQHYYIEWPMQSRDWNNSHLNQWKQLFPTGASPIRPFHSFVIDI
jgi:hypothetical protein